MKEKAFIFDIDGTLALRCDRSPYDWSKVADDHPNPPVIAALKALEAAGHTIVVFSGRESVCIEATMDWLANSGIHPDVFHMRKAGDTRKDCIVKREFFELIKDDYEIVGVFDDRKQVKRMWVELGLFVFDVNQTDAEF